MKKMRTLFEQNESFKVIDKLRDENKFILEDNYSVYRKRDGTSILIKNNIMYKRYDANELKGKKIPENSIPCQEHPAPSGSFPVWVRCKREDPSDKFHFEAFDKKYSWDNGTYELCGPKINGNKEDLSSHILIFHKSEKLEIGDLSFRGIEEYFKRNLIEGLVIENNENGLMTKIRRKDYGLKW